MIDLDTPFSQQLFDIAIRQPVAQIPAHSYGDHLRRKPEASEACSQRWLSRVATTHQHSLPEPPISGCNSALVPASGPPAPPPVTFP